MRQSTFPRRASFNHCELNSILCKLLSTDTRMRGVTKRKRPRSTRQRRTPSTSRRKRGRTPALPLEVLLRRRNRPRSGLRVRFSIRIRSTPPARALPRNELAKRPPNPSRRRPRETRSKLLTRSTNRSRAGVAEGICYWRTSSNWTERSIRLVGGSVRNASSSPSRQSRVDAHESLVDSRRRSCVLGRTDDALVSHGKSSLGSTRFPRS